MPSQSSTKTQSKPAKASTGQASSMAELMARQSQSFQGLKKGEVIDGTVKKLTPKEILLEIGAKSDALVIEYDKKNLENLLSLLKVGDKVKATVISPESEDGFPVVSLRRALDELMFSKFEKLISQTENMTVVVTDSTKGGYFVEDKSGIKGFLPNSQLVSDNLGAQDSVEVRVIEFDKSKKRVIFSEKATKYETRFSELSKLFKEGDSVSAVVESVTSYGVFTTIESKKGLAVEGFIHISEVSYQRVENLVELYSKGDKISAQVLGVDSENRRVNLSIKKTEKDVFEDVKEKYKLEQRITGVITSVKSRGITLQLAEGIEGFIQASKVPSSATYAVGDSVEVEVSDYDMKRRLVLVSPVLTTKFVGYR